MYMGSMADKMYKTKMNKTHPLMYIHDGWDGCLYRVHVGKVLQILRKIQMGF